MRTLKAMPVKASRKYYVATVALAVALPCLNFGAVQARASEAPQDTATTTINLSTAVPISESASYIIEYVAIHRGYFYRNHLNVNLTQFSGGGQEEAALASGSEDIILLSPAGAAAGLEKGVKETILAADGQGAGTFQLIVPESSTIKSPKQLPANATIGVSSAGSSTYYYALYLEKKFHVTVTPVPLGSPAYLVAVEAGKTIAAVADYPQDAAALADHQVREIGNFGKILPPNVSDTVIVADSFLNSHRRAVKQFMTAWDGALQWLQAAKHKSSVLQLIESQESVNAAGAKYLYGQDITGVHPRGAFTNSEIRTSLKISGISFSQLPDLKTFVSQSYS